MALPVESRAAWATGPPPSMNCDTANWSGTEYPIRMPWAEAPATRLRVSAGAPSAPADAGISEAAAASSSVAPSPAQIRRCRRVVMPFPFDPVRCSRRGRPARGAVEVLGRFPGDELPAPQGVGDHALVDLRAVVAVGEGDPRQEPVQLLAVEGVEPPDDLVAGHGGGEGGGDLLQQLPE